MRYRKKPVVIEATQFKIYDIVGLENVKEYCKSLGVTMQGPSNIVGFVLFHISTLEGEMSVNDGDWIITGVAGEKYPCKDAIFQKTYEKVEE
jgi:hypothetical protein